MSTTFIATLILSVIVVAYWRVALVLLLATVLALLLTGVNTIADAFAGRHQQPPIVAPANPGSAPEAPAQSSDSNPHSQPGPPS